MTGQQNRIDRRAEQSEAMAAALVANEGLVHRTVRRQWLGQLSYQDAVQVGRIALWRALVRYDASRGRWSSYAVVGIERAVWRAARRARRGAAERLDFATTFSYAALAAQLPLSLEVEADLPPSPKLKYLSHYQYLGHADLADRAALTMLSGFEIALRAVDCSNLRDLLAQQVYRPGARGQAPFDPVSMFLCLLLRLEEDLSWRKLACRVGGRGDREWRRLFGFHDGKTPCASGLRHFADALAPSSTAAQAPPSGPIDKSRVVAYTGHHGTRTPTHPR